MIVEAGKNMTKREGAAMLILLWCAAGKISWGFRPQLYILQLITKNDQQCSCPSSARKAAKSRLPAPPLPAAPPKAAPSSQLSPLSGFQIEIRESPYNLKSALESMDCVSRQGNYLDLKFEDNGDYYLINSFLGLEKNDGDGFLDDCIEDAASGRAGAGGGGEQGFGEQVVREAAAYLCFRTTSLREIMDYLAQYYRVPQAQRKAVLTAARRLKLQLKRAHARQRSPACEAEARAESLAVVPLEIKVEESELSPFLFDQESQETRKKKRNRMSAQNSRDRKKEYIRQIQNQNRELKRRLAHAERPLRTHHTNRQFLKIILCLGITCYANLHELGSQLPVPAADALATEATPCMAARSEPVGAAEGHLPLEMRLLNPWQQGAVAELMEKLGEGRPERVGTPEAGFQCTDLVSEAASERSTSSEGGRKSRKSQYL